MIKLLFTSATSACFELEGNSAYYAPKHYQVMLNGACVANGETNVFSVFELHPATEYQLSVLFEDGTAAEAISFQTKPETCAISVKAFGAVGDGITNDTTAIQTAIHFLPKGGRLYFPAGVYLTQPLALKSHMTLELSEDAVLLGTADRSLYPVIPGFAEDLNGSGPVNFGGFEGNELDMYQSLITAEFAEDITVVGRGKIDGNAQNSDFWTAFREFKPARPRLVFLNRCQNVVFHGVAACNGPSWHFHPYYSRELAFYDVSVTAPKNSPNTDALDPEACDQVQIIGCKFSVGDDCIAIKSGKIEMGLKYKQPASNHQIRNCLMEFGHGALTLGSEIAAGVRDVTVTQCYFSHTDRGLRIKTRRGRGKLCQITNVVFDGIHMESVLTPFVINMWYNCCDPDRYSEYNTTRECLPVDDRTPHLGKFTFRNIACYNSEVAACYIDGLPEMPIDEVEFSDVYVHFTESAKPGKPAMLNNGTEHCRTGFYLDNVRKVIIHNVTICNVIGDKLITGNCDSVSVTGLYEK